MKGVRKAGKGTLVSLSAGMGLASAATAVHFASLVNYVKALKDIGEEGIEPSVFMYVLFLSLFFFACMVNGRRRCSVNLTEQTEFFV